MPRNLREYMIEKVHPQIPGEKLGFVPIVVWNDFTRAPPAPLLTAPCLRPGEKGEGENCVQWTGANTFRKQTYIQLTPQIDAIIMWQESVEGKKNLQR